MKGRAAMNESVKRTNTAYELLMEMEPEERTEFLSFFCRFCGGSDPFHEDYCENEYYVVVPRNG